MCSINSRVKTREITRKKKRREEVKEGETKKKKMGVIYL